MKLSEIVTITIAAYGAILATFTYLAQRNDKKRIVDVIPSWGFFYYDNGMLSEEAYFFIEIVNKGHIAATVYTPYVILPNKKTIVFPNANGNVNFPYELMPGNSCRTWINTNEITRFLRSQGYNGNVQVKVAVKDATGKETIGRKKQKINLD